MKKKAKALIDRTLIMTPDGRFVVQIKVFEVSRSLKFPQGIKARFILLDTLSEKPRLLVDNHEPFGFHIHSRLPRFPKYRQVLNTQNHLEALEYFLSEAERLVRNET